MGIYGEVNEIPAFFEQVMLPPGTSPWPGFQVNQQPRGVFDFMCDPEFTSPDGGLFNFDTITDLDIILGSGASPVTANIDPGAPIDKQWVSLPPPNKGRWYPSAITLPNGSIFTISGNVLKEGWIQNNIPQMRQFI